MRTDRVLERVHPCEVIHVIIIPQLLAPHGSQRKPQNDADAEESGSASSHRQSINLLAGAWLNMILQMKAKKALHFTGLRVYLRVRV